VATTDLVFGGRTVRGSVTGTVIENVDNPRFALEHGIRSRNEVPPLSEAPEAYHRMVSGEARFRAVLDTRE
jgi:propanol-preferring alcohol dehydrogenase